MSPRVTLRDVARRAGLTPAGASRALRGDPAIPDPTRQRVLQAAAALRYVPNPAARALRSRSFRTIGALLFTRGDEDEIAIFGDALLAAADEAMHRGFGLLLLHVPLPAEGTTGPDVAAMVAQMPIDAAFCIGASSDDREPHVAALAGTGLPFVFLGHREVAGVAVPHVTTDYAAGSRLAVDHLAGLGHRRIALAVDPRKRHLPLVRARIEGYAAALRARGLESGPDLILDWDEHTAAAVVAPDPSTTAANVERLRRSSATAVYAVLFRTAQTLMHDLHVSGLAVPGDVAVVAFGDYPVARSQLPPLTVIRQPFKELGATAARLLLASLEGEAPAWPMVLQPDLVVRHSCGAAAVSDGLIPTFDALGAWE